MELRRQKHILIVEDDATLRELYHELLTGSGYKVDTAENGKIGLEKVLTGGYDLILLDIMLPIMDGVTVLKHAKQQESQKPNGPIVMLTSLSPDHLIHEGSLHGAAGYMIKSSLMPDQVLTNIEAYLAHP